MKLNINQIILYFLGVGFAGLTIYFQQQQEVWLASIGLFFTVILVVLAAFDPSSVMNLVIKSPGGHSSIELTRYTPPPQEVEEALALGSSDTDTPIANNPLVEAAQERSPDEKAATDYMLLVTNAWMEKRYDEGLQYAYQGLALKPEQRVKASLEIPPRDHILRPPSDGHGGAILSASHRDRS